MPVTINANKVKFKNPNGDGFISLDAVASKKTQDLVADLQARADQIEHSWPDNAINLTNRVATLETTRATKSELNNYLRIDTNAQNLTEQQKNNGRTNIDAANVADVNNLKSASDTFWSVNKDSIDWVRGSINSADGTNNDTANKRIRCRTSAIMIEDQIIIADDVSRFYVYFYHGTPSSSTFDGHTGGWIRLCNISDYASEHYPNADRFRIVGSMADNSNIGDGESPDVSACTDHIFELYKYATASESAKKFGYVRILNSNDTLDSIYTPGAYRWTSSNRPIDSPTTAAGYMLIYGPSNDGYEGKAAIVITSSKSILIRGSSSQGWGSFTTFKAIEVDDSLSVLGAAADSKAVGDALNDANEALDKKFGYVRILNSNDTLDSIYTPGAYRWTSSNRPADSPIAQAGSMFIYGPSNDNIEGKTCLIVANGKMLSRFSTSAGWLPWTVYGDSDLIYDMPKSLGAYNCIMRAKQLSSIQYRTKSILPNQNDDVSADNDVTGIPYSSSRYENLYVPVCVSFDTFMTAAMNPNSYLYTRVSSIGDGDTLLGNSKTYYGDVCSSLVSYCLGFEDIIYTTHQIGELSAFRLLDDQNCYALELGDVILNPDDHIVIVTEIARTKKGKIKYVEITEAWPPFCRSKHYSVDQMNQMYFNNPNKPNYKAYRYDDINSITYTPSPWVPLDDETGTPVYNRNLSPRRGDKAVWMPGEKVEIDITDAGSYTAYKLYKDDTLLSTQQISGALVTLSSLSYGKYKLCLTDGSNDSDFVYWIVVDEPEVSVQYLGNRKIRARFSCHNAEATNIAWCSAGIANNYRHLYAVRSTTRLTESEKQAGVVENTFEGNNWDTIVSEANGKCYIRFMWKTEYGYYSRNYTEINLT